jgi:hypothetical protein
MTENDAGRAGVRRIDNTWITLPDGTRLGARLWLPDDAEQHPVPAILEYLPYRKDERTAWQDSTRHPYFAERGYAAVRVDIRGTGDADGIIAGEYLVQEHDDALEVIAWIAEQPWCSGSVGMIGYSWGGFNGLQVAARRPPALGAVVSLHSTDDRYLDDCHHIGGAVLANDILRWAQTMRAIDALPPSPEVVGDRWREMWRARLEHTPHFAADWLAHQRYDDFWKHGSIAEDYAAIRAATFVVGGWADAYTNAVPRMLEHLTCPRAGLIGPWAHIFPERGVPGPAIGFLQQSVIWFDRWLKGVRNEVDQWPLLRAWMQESAPPAARYEKRPGRWLSVSSWPPSEVATQPMRLGAEGALVPGEPCLEDADPGDGALELSGVQSCGEAGGVWCQNGRPDEGPLDQRVDDARSLTFDTEPLASRLELFGRPVATLDLALDRPVAHVAVRLCDVAPDGSSALITYGVLNLAHRNGHERPEALEPGRRYRVRVDLKAIGQAIESGHRLRLALSPTHWPMVWPAPEQVRLSLFAVGCCLDLPVWTRAPADDPPVRFGPPEYAEPLALAREEATRVRTIERTGAEAITREHELFEEVLAEDGTRIREENSGAWLISDDDPLSARFECARDYSLERGEWRVRIVASADMTCDATLFRIAEKLEAFEADERVYGLERGYEISRDHT